MSHPSSLPINILPYDGQTFYYGDIFTGENSAKYMKILFDTIQWKNDEAKLFGKHFITKRKAAWYGDREYPYTYSNTTKHALPWTTELLEIKDAVEKMTNTTFNSCLLNLYHDGNEGMAWHSDDEKALARESGIASVSFGATRKFAFKHKVSKTIVEIILEPGSLLLMKGTTQSHWFHRLPKTTKVMQPRINLTFRTMRETEIPI